MFDRTTWAEVPDFYWTRLTTTANWLTWAALDWEVVR